MQKLILWFDSFITNLPNILLASLVLILAFYLSKKISKKVINSLNKRVQQNSVKSLIGSAISIAIVVLGIVLSLGILNLDQALNSLIAGAGVAGIAIGLAVQGTLSNTFSGISLSIKNDINVGDFIESNGFAGTVEEINLRDTKIRTVDNNLVIVPNNSISNNPYKNYSLTRDLRVVVEVGIGYESDLERVIQITEQAITNEFSYRKEDFEFYYTTFGDSSINIQIRFWIQATEKYALTRAKSRAIRIIKKTYDQESINIPFPIRTIMSS
jgi:small conductance mechanosensitive channel